MISVLLHNIRSAYNVGSIFRTADASGVFSLYLSGYTPLPKDRFGKVNEKIAKTALGAENSVSWERVSLSSFLKSARAGGWSVVGVEQDARAVDYRKYKAKKKTLLVFGNEVRGLSKSLRDECDALFLQFLDHFQANLHCNLNTQLQQHSKG